ncbi:hypothetical protein AALA22_13175, partial [Anaerovoracaceae bacterium 41-7]
KNKPTSDPRLCGKELCQACDTAIRALQEPERKHGEWVLDVGVSVESFICSQCGINTDMRYGLYKYCPNCGAIMDGKE